MCVVNIVVVVQRFNDLLRGHGDIDSFLYPHAAALPRAVGFTTKAASGSKEVVMGYAVYF